MLTSAVADIFWARKEERQLSKEQERQGDVEFKHLCHHWDSLKVNQDGLLTI